MVGCSGLLLFYVPDSGMELALGHAHLFPLPDHHYVHNIGRYCGQQISGIRDPPKAVISAYGIINLYLHRIYIELVVYQP